MEKMFKSKTKFENTIFSLWLMDKRPLFNLVYLPFLGCLCLIGVEKYLHIRIDVITLLTSIAIIFGIYSLNKFTDTTEDFTNDIEKLLFFADKNFIFFMACASIVGSIIFLFYKGQLNWVHFLLYMNGIGYSYKCVPFYNQKKGFHFIRIKEILILKNISVAFLWGAGAFLIPILASPQNSFNLFIVTILALGLFFLTFSNTLFEDILDFKGDLVAGIKTLPTYWGVKKSILLLIILNTIWILAVIVIWLFNRLNLAHAIILNIYGMYSIF